MALHVKLINGRKYVYDVKSYRDSETKKVKKKTTYMGPCTDEKTKSFAPKKKQAVTKDDFSNRQIVNYGDANILWRSLMASDLAPAIFDVMPDNKDTLLALIFYKILMGEAHKDAEVWYEGSYAKILFPNARLESQRVSETLCELGKESVQRKFFGRYIGEIAETSGEVVVDSTGMENEIEIPLTEYGGRSGDIRKETKMIMVVDRITHVPLYFRLVAGNIVDVSTLITTFSLMGKFGLSPSMVLMDAGYYSEKNIRSLFKSEIAFLTRLPAGRRLYKELIGQTAKTLESAQNIVIYNKRSLYMQRIKTDVCGYVGYAYVCCDIKQRGCKLDKFIREAKEDKLSNDEISEKMPYIGKFILVSDKEMEPSELLPLYYTRQVAENTFGFAKSRLNLLPLRVHSIETLRGYMFLCYLALLLSIEIQGKLTKLCTLHEALAIGHNQFCEVFVNNCVPLEPNRRLCEVYDTLGTVVVSSSGE